MAESSSGKERLTPNLRRRKTTGDIFMVILWKSFGGERFDAGREVMVNGPRREIEGRVYCVASFPHLRRRARNTRPVALKGSHCSIDARVILRGIPNLVSSLAWICAKWISCVIELWPLCHLAECAWLWIARGPFEGLDCFPLWQQKSVVA
jgi:hypothetical protein